MLKRGVISSINRSLRAFTPTKESCCKNSYTFTGNYLNCSLKKL